MLYHADNNCLKLSLWSTLKLAVRGRTATEKLENGIFILKTQQMFFVHAMPEKFENVTITSHFVFVFGYKLGWEIT